MNYHLYWIVPRDDYQDYKEIENQYSYYCDEFKKRDIYFKFINLFDCSISYNKVNGLNLLYNENIITKKNASFIISNTNLCSSTRSLALSIRHCLRFTNSKLLNESILNMELMEWDKLLQASFVSSLNIPVVNFISLGSPKKIDISIQYLHQECDKVIVKPVSSGMGFGILKSDDKKLSRSISQIISTSHTSYFASKFVENSYDMRLYYMFGELIFVKIRIPSKNSYLANTTFDCIQKIFSKEEFLEELQINIMYKDIFDKSNYILSMLNNNIIAIDWLVNDDVFYFNEMGTAETGFSQLPKQINDKVFNRFEKLIKGY